MGTARARRARVCDRTPSGDRFGERHWPELNESTSALAGAPTGNSRFAPSASTFASPKPAGREQRLRVTVRRTLYVPTVVVPEPTKR
eukprot:4990444-Prymnesium_polylepis.2